MHANRLGLHRPPGPGAGLHHDEQAVVQLVVVQVGKLDQAQADINPVRVDKHHVRAADHGFFQFPRPFCGRPGRAIHGVQTHRSTQAPWARPARRDQIAGVGLRDQHQRRAFVRFGRQQVVEQGLLFHKDPPLFQAAPASAARGWNARRVATGAVPILEHRAATMLADDLQVGRPGPHPPGLLIANLGHAPRRRRIRQHRLQDGAAQVEVVLARLEQGLARVVEKLLIGAAEVRLGRDHHRMLGALDHFKPEVLQTEKQGVVEQERGEFRGDGRQFAQALLAPPVPAQVAEAGGVVLVVAFPPASLDPLQESVTGNEAADAAIRPAGAELRVGPIFEIEHHRRQPAIERAGEGQCLVGDGHQIAEGVTGVRVVAFVFVELVNRPDDESHAFTLPVDQPALPGQAQKILRHRQAGHRRLEVLAPISRNTPVARPGRQGEVRVSRGDSQDVAGEVVGDRQLSSTVHRYRVANEIHLIAALELEIGGRGLETLSPADKVIHLKPALGSAEAEIAVGVPVLDALPELDGVTLAVDLTVVLPERSAALMTGAALGLKVGSLAHQRPEFRLRVFERFALQRAALRAGKEGLDDQSPLPRFFSEVSMPARDDGRPPTEAVLGPGAGDHHHHRPGRGAGVVQKLIDLPHVSDDARAQERIGLANLLYGLLEQGRLGDDERRPPVGGGEGVPGLQGPATGEGAGDGGADECLAEAGRRAEDEVIALSPRPGGFHQLGDHRRCRVFLAFKESALTPARRLCLLGHLLIQILDQPRGERFAEVEVVGRREGGAHRLDEWLPPGLHVVSQGGSIVLIETQKLARVWIKGQALDGKSLADDGLDIFFIVSGQRFAFGQVFACAPAEDVSDAALPKDAVIHHGGGDQLRQVAALVGHGRAAGPILFAGHDEIAEGACARPVEPGDLSQHRLVVQLTATKVRPLANRSIRQRQRIGAGLRQGGRACPQLGHKSLCRLGVALRSRQLAGVDHHLSIRLVVRIGEAKDALDPVVGGEKLREAGVPDEAVLRQDGDQQTAWPEVGGDGQSRLVLKALPPPVGGIVLIGRVVQAGVKLIVRAKHSEGVAADNACQPLPGGARPFLVNFDAGSGEPPCPPERLRRFSLTAEHIQQGAAGIGRSFNLSGNRGEQSLRGGKVSRLGN